MRAKLRGLGGVGHFLDHFDRLGLAVATGGGACSTQGESRRTRSPWWRGISQHLTQLRKHRGTTLETRLSTVPRQLATLPELRVLRLGRSHIVDLPAELAAAPALDKLSLELNPLTEVPSVCFDSPTLTGVSLRGTKVPASEIERLRKARPQLQVVF